MERPIATLYSTWQQLPTATKPVAFLMVIKMQFRKGELERYTLLNMDGLLKTAEISPEVFETLIEDKLLQPWVPGAVKQADLFTKGTR